jgi:hypothetical protein
MAISNVIKSPLIPTSLRAEMPIEAVKAQIMSGLDVSNNNTPKKHLEVGDILKFNYFERTKYKLTSQKEASSVLNPIIICCGFDTGRIHGIDLRVLNMKDQGSATEISLFSEYKKKYYDFQGNRKLIPYTDMMSFNPLSINSGIYGKNLHKFYRSYKLDKISARHVIIINIYQAERESSNGHMIS